MAQFFDHIPAKLQEFIGRQRVFFTASATADSRINLSPKGSDCLRVLDQHQVVYLDQTGSGNETAAHLLRDGRITLMFCSFDGNAEIARIYGRGAVIHPSDQRWPELSANFPKLPGVRQVMEIRVESAMTSCGYAVPRMREMAARDTLEKYWIKNGERAKEEYWQKHNLRSIDGLPTSMPEASRQRR